MHLSTVEYEGVMWVQLFALENTVIKFGFHTRHLIPLPTERQLTSQKGFFYMGFVP
jgi:hypothetical protein